ncbi:MAG: YaaL family protein [Firmicutes bacterium]|nr:YaaL family protein [Bacillota bacterium]
MKGNRHPYSEREFLLQSLQSARLELNDAASLCNELTDWDAIDYASYNLLAARTRYSYLLKLAKEKQLSL